jgi:hypothetical protein
MPRLAGAVQNQARQAAVSFLRADPALFGREHVGVLAMSAASLTRDVGRPYCTLPYKNDHTWAGLSRLQPNVLNALMHRVQKAEMCKARAMGARRDCATHIARHGCEASRLQ